MGILYYFFYISAFLISRLPFRVIYWLSDILYFILYHIARYRKSLVYSNLEKSFPGKPENEIRDIAKKYYRNLSDIIMEVLKWQNITKEQMQERFIIENHHLFKQSFEKGRSFILTVGHMGNWEWLGTALDLVTKEKGYAVVKPLSDRRFDKYLVNLRLKMTDGGTIPFKNTFRTMLRNKKEGLTFTLFAADQTPTKDEINYWTRFLNQETGFFQGTEKIARALDFDVLFIDVQRQGRGRYLGTISVISDNPKATAENEITEGYVKKLEQAIINHPDNWLWSHRRWKHKKEAES
jgi:KDO2-lipid IV(A) lauroyltransferase